MYHVYQKQAAASYSSLYFFIFLSLQFSTLKYFVILFSGTMRPRRLKVGTHMDSGQMYHVYQNQAVAAYSSLYFFILSNFQHWNFWSHFSRELWGLEDWNLVHTWIVGRCIMYTGIRLLLLIRPYISSFFFSIFIIEIFRHTFLGNYGAQKIENWYTRGHWADVSCIPDSGCYCLFIPLFLHFSFLQISTL